MISTFNLSTWGTYSKLVGRKLTKYVSYMVCLVNVFSTGIGHEIQLIQKKYSKTAGTPGEYFKGMIVLRRKSLMLLYLHVISRTVAETYVVIEIYLSYKYAPEYKIYIDIFYFFCTEPLKSQVNFILAPQCSLATL